MIDIFNGRYAIDRHGNVYSWVNNAGNRRSKPLKLKPFLNSKTGYLQVNVFVFENGVKKKKLVLIHRLVALSFIPNPFNKPEVNHKDGNKNNNSWLNLEWATVSENAKHAFDLGLRTPNRGQLGKINQLSSLSKAIHQLDMNGNFIQEFPSMAEAKRAGFSQGNISEVIAGRRQSHKGFKWILA